jgi:hypothetical protein
MMMVRELMRRNGGVMPDTEQVRLVVDHLEVLERLHALPLLLLVEEDRHVLLLAQDPAHTSGGFSQDNFELLGIRYNIYIVENHIYKYRDIDIEI